DVGGDDPLLAGLREERNGPRGQRGAVVFHLAANRGPPRTAPRRGHGQTDGEQRQQTLRVSQRTSKHGNYSHSGRWGDKFTRGRAARRQPAGDVGGRGPELSTQVGLQS